MRMAAWIVVTAAVFRVAGKPAFALLGRILDAYIAAKNALEAIEKRQARGATGAW